MKSKDKINALTGLLMGMADQEKKDFIQYTKLDDLDATRYLDYRKLPKSFTERDLTNKQKKSRSKAKLAKKARKKNR